MPQEAPGEAGSGVDTAGTPPALPLGGERKCGLGRLCLDSHSILAPCGLVPAHGGFLTNTLHWRPLLYLQVS